MEKTNTAFTAHIDQDILKLVIDCLSPVQQKLLNHQIEQMAIIYEQQNNREKTDHIRSYLTK